MQNYWYPLPQLSPSSNSQVFGCWFEKLVLGSRMELLDDITELIDSSRIAGYAAGWLGLYTALLLCGLPSIIVEEVGVKSIEYGLASDAVVCDEQLLPSQPRCDEIWEDTVRF
uniref:Uncharacterized protein n=1 Tax=Caenorhabditis japonica TaxID=281687 RepID=A0A8R1IUH4_CAEJA